MRIAIFTETYYPFISGVVTHIETLKNGLESRGHEVLIVTLSPKSKKHHVKDGVLYCPAIPMRKLYGYGAANPINLRRLSILKAFNPDVIHIHTEFSMGLFGVYVAQKLKKPIVYTLHTMYDDYMFYLSKHKKIEDMVKPVGHFYFRKVAGKATEIIGPSTKVVEFLRRCNVNRHINIIPNIVDLTEFLPENVDKDLISERRKEMGLSKKDIGICFIGRLGREKSIDVLINFVAEKVKENKHIKLIIIGDGPEKDSLNNQIKALQMEDNISMLGRIDHEKLPAYYSACDLFSTASLSEINSISMLEAMASGLYVLQRLDIYNKNQICQGENGDLFTTSKEFSLLINEYSSKTPEERKAMRKVVTDSTKRYGEKEFMANILNVYERAVDTFNKKKAN